MATRNAFDYPTDAAVVDDSYKITSPWGAWVTRIHQAILANQQSGPTAQRPNAILWLGRRYFDTTLGKPVFVKQVTPSIVWVTADGVVA